ncbi:hypothetical protein N8I84_39685 [Streptomyces cynarae]|uniref:Amino acid decarboxylase n=1 Tax=Streptomyces cynarae TaxID=2981134 RepID=A0ABY6EC48_9ACTN|nr:hypothetical protein [Streptomyces cynarae]UXY24135.1 hypothetical protein N8I84_39685 [Streptomyces cynarae]
MKFGLLWRAGTVAENVAIEPPLVNRPPDLAGGTVYTTAVYATLSGVAELEVPQRPDLSTVIFRIRPADGSRAAAERADEASRRLLKRINGHQRIVLSRTVVDSRYTLRVCVVSHRTHRDRIAEALKIITAEARNIPVA